MMWDSLQLDAKQAVESMDMFDARLVKLETKFEEFKKQV